MLGTLPSCRSFPEPVLAGAVDTSNAMPPPPRSRRGRNAYPGSQPGRRQFLGGHFSDQDGINAARILCGWPALLRPGPLSARCIVKGQAQSVCRPCRSAGPLVSLRRCPLASQPVCCSRAHPDDPKDWERTDAPHMSDAHMRCGLSASSPVRLQGCLARARASVAPTLRHAAAHAWHAIYLASISEQSRAISNASCESVI